MKSEQDLDNAMRRLEAALFLARSPLHSRKLAQMADLEDGTQARTLIRRLNENYSQTGRSFCIKNVAGGFQLRTRPQFNDWLQRLSHRAGPTRLTSPAMETLAVVAYRQPVIKADIEAVRGVSCGELLRQLMDRGLVKIAGRSSQLGHPFLYATTKKFLEVFGLSSIDALPRGDKLVGRGLPSWPNVPESPTVGEGKNHAEIPPNPLDEPQSNSENQQP